MEGSKLSREIIALIPAYEPTRQLLWIVEKLVSKNVITVVVNDGSNSSFDQVFQETAQYATVLNYEKNCGKGYALRTGLQYIKDHYHQPSIVVTLDADGQHSVKDTIMIAEAAMEHPESLTIGARSFTGNVPKRSRFGNSITREVYRLFTGVNIHDTQTGLRAFGSECIPFLLSIQGDRYEYEMNILFECAHRKIPIYEKEIETIYVDNNEGSHFRSVKDSVRIYGNIVKFAASSFLGFLIDYILYSILVTLFESYHSSSYLLAANIIARVVSASVNFIVNKRVVFKNQEQTLRTGIQYFLLACCILIGNTILLSILVSILGMNEYFAKVLTEITFFTISWLVQKHVIFHASTHSKKKREGRTYEKID